MLPTLAGRPAPPAEPAATSLQVGDLIFICVGARPFREVAAATGSWTNHVGIVIDTSGPEPLIAESTFPVARQTPLSRFMARSQNPDGSRPGRVEVRRLRVALPPQATPHLQAAARRRLGTFYDTGFNLHSRRQFCSRFVREVLQEATGLSIGRVETFAELLTRQPTANLRFWRLWYFGRIPWQRRTVTPASLLDCPALQPVGAAVGGLVSATVNDFPAGSSRAARLRPDPTAGRRPSARR